MNNRLKRLVCLGLTCVTLGACVGAGGSGQEAGLFQAAFSQVGQGVFNRNSAVPARFTATRDSLQAGGITQPVLVARFETSGIHVGLLEFRTVRGVTVWRSLDGNTLSTADGLLRNTRGFGIDPYSFETAPLQRALQAGAETAEYARIYRSLDGENQLVASRFYCRLMREGAERVNVLGRAYDTTRLRETCHVDGHTASVFENTYWQGRGNVIWRSRQWAGPVLGYAELERVIN